MKQNTKMKRYLRKPFIFKLSLNLVISVYCFLSILQSCILAKSYDSRIGSVLRRFYRRNQETPNFPIVQSQTWEPRENYLDDNSKLVKYFERNILPPEPRHENNVILPQMDPSGNDEDWEKSGDCKVTNMVV